MVCLKKIKDLSRSWKGCDLNHIITIDGPTGSGKSTVSRMLAERLSYIYLDTGAMYRAVAVALKRSGVDMKNEGEVAKLCRDLDIRLVPDGETLRVYLADDDITLEIRGPDVDLLASDVSAIPAVRRSMTGLQRKIGSRGPMVAEGRDMGTVVFPDARHKFYIDASLEERVDRRFRERKNRGEHISIEDVRKALIKRDHQDINRKLAPLRTPENAKSIDTTGLTPGQIVEDMVREIDRRSR